MQTLLKLLTFVALASVSASASDADSRAAAAFERKTEKNAIFARNLAKRLTRTTDQRKASDTSPVPYKSNFVSAYVRRVEKQKVRDAARAAKKKREEDLKKQNSANDNPQPEPQLIDDIMDNSVRKHRHKR